METNTPNFKELSLEVGEEATSLSLNCLRQRRGCGLVQRWGGRFSTKIASAPYKDQDLVARS